MLSVDTQTEGLLSTDRPLKAFSKQYGNSTKAALGKCAHFQSASRARVCARRGRPTRTACRFVVKDGGGRCPETKSTRLGAVAPNQAAPLGHHAGRRICAAAQYAKPSKQMEISRAEVNFINACAPTFDDVSSRARACGATPPCCCSCCCSCCSSCSPRTCTATCPR